MEECVSGRVCEWKGELRRVVDKRQGEILGTQY